MASDCDPQLLMHDEGQGHGGDHRLGAIANALRVSPKECPRLVAGIRHGLCGCFSRFMLLVAELNRD
jgi:hypothetical protein